MKSIIVCGTGRSGTSIFTRLLGQHQLVWAFRWESQLLSGVPGLADLMDLEALGGLEDTLGGRGSLLGWVRHLPLVRAHRQRLRYRRLVKEFRARVLTSLYRRRVRDTYEAGLFTIIDHAALKAAVLRLEDELLSAADLEGRQNSARRFCEAVFVPAARSQDALFWCEKTPRNLLQADTIAGILPDAKFLHVVRDGRDVVSSIMARQFWPVAGSVRYPATRMFTGPQTFEKVVHYWTTLIDIGRMQEERIGAARWMNVRLEDLVVQPRATMDGALKFLEISGDDAFFRRLERQLRKSSAHTGRWRRDLTEGQIQQLLVSSRSNLERYGYV